MILAFDTYYFDNKAKTVCISFKSFSDNSIDKIYSEVLEIKAEYISGEFYKRELPCVLSLLDKINITDIHAIVIDGFVYLDDNHNLGLGGHLYHSLLNKIPIIGVAKNDYLKIEINKRLLKRGNSLKPLFVTSIGIDINEATELIKNMDGDYRIPTALKYLDTLTKQQ